MPASPALVFLDLAVGATIFVTGTLSWRLRPRTSTGRQLALTGGLWFLGFVLPAAVLLHRGALAQALGGYPNGRVRGRVAIGIVIGVYVGAVAEPWLATTALTLTMAVLFLGLAIASVWAAAGPERQARRLAAAMDLSIFGVLVFSALNQTFAMVGDDVVLVVYDVVVAAICVALLVGLLRGRWGATVVQDLVVALDTASRSRGLAGELRRALGDPELMLGYWAPSINRYVDDRGEPISERPDNPTRVVTYISDDNGAPLAVLVHDRSVLDEPTLVDGIAAATRMAVTSARTQVEIRQRMSQLEESRRHMVEVADAQRAGLVADLEAGPQKHLSEARRQLDIALTSSGEPEIALLLGEVDRAGDDLRDFAQGIRPRALVDGGLQEALPVLAGRAPVPVTLRVCRDRFPAAAEATVYFVCAEAITNATKHAHATRLSIEVRSESGSIRAEVSDDGAGGADPEGPGLRRLRDRVEALGGVLRVQGLTPSGTVVAARIPATFDGGRP